MRQSGDFAVPVVSTPVSVAHISGLQLSPMSPGSVILFKPLTLRPQSSFSSRISPCAYSISVIAPSLLQTPKLQPTHFPYLNVLPCK